ncbi:MAG: thioredoxin domain-containing protein [Deltaproteobacteria bacterium]|nr:thioredoxin domain-containing protein [Deltaproteobacteria bacterium]
MPNALIHETSPYLLQHANNPVDWLPWGAEAFSRARSEDRPILLSVGYSACHWCHVMEHESFEDPATAGAMNSSFINVKVDREERPDVDEIYMHAVQAFTGGHGGWPMTLFLLPDGRPFLGGTYFPKHRRFGSPAFMDVLEHAKDVYRQRKAEVVEVADEVSKLVQKTESLPKKAPLESGWLEAIAADSEGSFDSRHGGFGHAPKFPPHATLTALLAHHQLTRAPRSLAMVISTLDSMAQGGMYDHLGGGFARYSVDERWCIPHFEKMLYDNALLAPIYLDAFVLTGSSRFERIARGTLGWIRTMQHSEGGFFAATDADSEGEEGKFFVFRPKEILEILGPEDGKRALEALTITKEGSFEHGASVVRLRAPLGEVAAEDLELLDRVRSRLFEARERRTHPQLDDKVIASWNGLALAAFARGFRVLGDESYARVARGAARFVLGSMVSEGRLMRTWKKGRARHLGCADDHVFVTHGLLELYEATQEVEWLDAALALAGRALELFWDDEEGALFFTGHDAEKLIARTKSFLGGALPSPNGLAALVFLKLGLIAGRFNLIERAESILGSFAPLVGRAPRALGVEAIAAEWLSRGGHELAIVGPKAECLPFVREVHTRYLPMTVLASAEAGARDDLELLRDRAAIGGRATAYLCARAGCQLPTSDLEEWVRQLDELSPRRAARVTR